MVNKGHILHISIEWSLQNAWSILIMYFLSREIWAPCNLKSFSHDCYILMFMHGQMLYLNTKHADFEFIEEFEIGIGCKRNQFILPNINEIIIIWVYKNYVPLPHDLLGFTLLNDHVRHHGIAYSACDKIFFVILMIHSKSPFGIKIKFMFSGHNMSTARYLSLSHDIVQSQLCQKFFPSHRFIPYCVPIASEYW